MPQRTLRFRIRQDGRVEELVEGVVGQSCQQLTERIEDAVGVLEKTQPTAEAFLRSKTQSRTISTELL